MRGELAHADAIERAPTHYHHHYHSLRLHRGTLQTTLNGEEQIELATTLYLDFDVTPTWRAVRIG